MWKLFLPQMDKVLMRHLHRISFACYSTKTRYQESKLLGRKVQFDCPNENYISAKEYTTYVLLTIL